MPGNNHSITVAVVVSGFEVSVTINRDHTVEQLIRQALKEAQQPHEGNLDDWELRSAEGHVFPHDQTLEAAGIVTGVKLYLNKGAGGGGS